MATLNIGGKSVSISDEFLKLSPDRQNDVVSEIAKSLGIGSKPVPAEQRVAIPNTDAMGNVTGATEDVTAPEMKPSAARDQSDDIIKGFAGGVLRGTAGMAGLVTDTIPNLVVSGVDRIEQKVRGESDDERKSRVAERRKNVMLPGVSEALSTEGIQKFLERISAEAYEPTSTAGKFSSAAGEFAPGGAIGRAENIVRNVIGYGIIPGLASEGAGQAFKGSAAEPYARAAGAIGAGFGTAAAQRLGSAERLVKNATEGMTPAQLDQMEALFLQAQREGIPISRAEAAQAVTHGSTGLGDLQHTIEGMGGMKQFYAQRPAQNEAAARQAFDSIAPPTRDPSQVGPAAGQAAERVVNDVTQAINRNTRPLYQAAEPQRVGAQVQQALVADPLYARTLREVRGDPALNRTIEHLPDDSVGVIDLVQRRMREQAETARVPGQASTSNLAAANFEDARNVPLAAADTVTGSRPGVAGSYETARNVQAQLREQYLSPLMNGPIGKLAGQDTTTKAAVEALFPANPLAGSSEEIGNTVRALSRQRPGVANDLVRAHAEMTFNEAAQRLASGGPNQSGGAKFAATIRGNSQQAENLESAVRALPQGDQTWRAFNSILDVMEAQQFRQATGSRTAFKIPGVEDLRSGGALNNAGRAIATGGIKLPQKVSAAIDNWNLGRNLDEIANMLTDPALGQEFRRLATVPAGSQQSVALLSRLVNMTGEANRVPRVYIPTERGE